MVSTCLKASAPLDTSAAPWRAEPSLFRHGAAYIEDADGELIGWATDTAGHTTEDTAPDRRDPRQTLLNAYTMALAPQAITALMLFMEAAPGAIVTAHSFRGSHDVARLKHAQKQGQLVLDQVRHAFARAAMRCAI